jgi:ubiquinone/menaquinone biosynthesis C-methylase UbiE
MKQLQQFFENKTINNVLDIGTGTGDFIKILNDTFNGNAKLTGIDPGEEWLKEARARFPQENIQFICMGSENLQFENDSFDVVAISNALHHLGNIELSFSEMKRVVLPNGWLVINEISDGELNEAQENQKMLHHFKSFVDRLHGISHRRTWSKDEILEIVQQNGVDVVLSYSHNKTKQVNFDELLLDEKYHQMESLLEELQGRPEYDDKKDLLPVFKDRLKKYGFQMATQLMVIGKVKQKK